MLRIAHCLDNRLTDGGKIVSLTRTLLPRNIIIFMFLVLISDRLCGLVVRVHGYRSGGPGSIPGTTRKKNVMGLKRGALSLVSTN
jgi:hypothetical protein